MSTVIALSEQVLSQRLEINAHPVDKTGLKSLRRSAASCKNANIVASNLRLLFDCSHATACI
jgi:hypothetical protein